MSEDGVMTKEPRHYKLNGSAAQSYVSAICRTFLHPSAATAKFILCKWPGLDTPAIFFVCRTVHAASHAQQCEKGKPLLTWF
jgi:hypothetical protein